MQEKIFKMQQFASYIHLFFMHLLANIVWREKKNMIFIFIFRKQLARLFEVLLMALITYFSIIIKQFKKNFFEAQRDIFFCQTVIASNSTS